MDFGGQGLCFHVGMWCCLHIKFSILNSTSIMESIVLRSQGLLRSGPCHTMLEFCLTWSWTGNHSCCESMSVIVCHVQKTAFYTTLAFIFSCSSLMSPETRRVGEGGNWQRYVLFRAGHPQSLTLGALTNSEPGHWLLPNAGENMLFWATKVECNPCLCV